MKTIIAGSRTITGYIQVVRAVSLAPFPVTMVISGGARGVDKLGEQYALLHQLPCEQYLAQWDTYGKSAGYRRNVQMADVSEALIALWDGKSRGTKHMIDIMTERGKSVFVIKPDSAMED